MVAATPTAALADWRYCLASSDIDHLIYISEPFWSNEPMGIIQNAFDGVLHEAHVIHHGVQCPRADDEAAIGLMRRDAIRFNRQQRNQIREIRWRGDLD